MLNQMHQARLRIDVAQAHAQAPLVWCQNPMDPSAVCLATRFRFNVQEQDLDRVGLDTDQIHGPNPEPRMQDKVPGAKEMFRGNRLANGAEPPLRVYVSAPGLGWGHLLIFFAIFSPLRPTT